MFAIEQSTKYDPARPAILDGRPLSMQYARTQSPLRGSDAVRKENVPPVHTSPGQSPVKSPFHERDSATDLVLPLSPSRFNSPPTKSSLSKKTGAGFGRSGFDPDTGIWEDDDDIKSKELPAGRGLHRHHKSVTFDQKPPQVNEYEMTTPAPSSNASESREGSYASTEDDYEEDEEEAEFERGSSMDHDDSFDASLEDTEKTPVVLPEDWRFMSPKAANTELARQEEDVFEEDCGSPAPSARPGSLAVRPHQTSAGSVDSNGQSRPLPPLPPAPGAQARPRSENLSGAFERMSLAHRSLPTLPMGATVSKADIHKMGVSSSLTADDRLRLMALQEQDRERRMRRLGSKDTSPVRGSSLEEAPSHFDQPGPEWSESRNSTPQLSRASVLQGLRDQSDQDSRESSEDILERSRSREMAAFDPDVPIPSMEDPTQPRVKDEEEPEELDLYSIPDMYAHREGSDSNASASQDDDLTSQYSQASLAALALPSMAMADDEQDTPKAQSPVHETGSNTLTSGRVSLPEFTDFGNASGFDVGFASYLTQKEDKSKLSPVAPASTQLPDLAALRQSIQRSYTPDLPNSHQQSPLGLAIQEARSGSPDSVLRHPTEISISPINRNDTSPKHTYGNDGSPKHTYGSQVESDRSISPSDSGSVIVNNKEPSPVSAFSSESEDEAEMAMPESPARLEIAGPETQVHQQSDEKRVSSLVQLEIPQDELEDSLGLGLEKEFDRVVEAQKVEFELSLQRLHYPFNGRFPSNELPEPKDSRVANPMENVPVLPKPRGARSLQGKRVAISPAVTFEENSFANRAGRRQRGYLMRQNTKIVVASERISQDECRSPELPGVHEDGSLAPRSPSANLVQPSPRKTSQPTWTAEPWNGRMRRKSIRVGGEKAVSKRKPVDGGAVPPLPGQASNVQETLDAVAEDEIAEDEEWEEGTERGRLFVKVVGVKDLQLPFPQRKHAVSCLDLWLTSVDERTFFSLTLDNGVDCVTTAWLDLARSAPIGQEFELVVLNDLEFQLTLQMKLEEPKQARPQSPSKPPASPKKQGAFGRFFGSPKKRKELEMKAVQDAQTARRPVTPPSAYDLVQGLVAKDGTFARAYVSSSEHETRAYGRPYTVDITCFNEWALEEVNVGSSRSKKGVTQLRRRPPYEIGTLEVQLLYVPKPRGAKDEDMPKSMNGAIRALREAEDRLQQQANIQGFEGYLSQQGGDCPVRYERGAFIPGVC
jgi:hypothetical protein